MMGHEKSSAGRARTFNVVRSCSTCSELFEVWNKAAKAHAQTALELSKDIGQLSAEQYRQRRSAVDAALSLTNETHLSYRLHRTHCPVAMSQR
jgi:hypothetical protein